MSDWPAGRVISVRIGEVAPLGPDKVASAFIKRAVAARVAVGEFGLEGDSQADHRVHGGFDKAVYCYAEESYALWRESHPMHAAIWGPGAVGENLTTTGLSEQTLCIGDVLRIGNAILQVTEPRQPCFKFALRFGDKLLPRAMIRNGLSGWYCRVREDGTIGQGDAITVLERPHPDWPVRRMAALFHAKDVDAATMEAFHRLRERL